MDGHQLKELGDVRRTYPLANRLAKSVVCLVAIVSVLPLANPRCIGQEADVARAAESALEHAGADPESVATDDDEDASQPSDQDQAGKINSELESLLDQDLTSLRRTSVAPSLDVEVTSVSRQKSTIGRSPAAVFVITEEMIKRSGYQSVPELLRLAPGLQVARIDGNKWSISSRGGAGRFSDKLLVQIDGLTVYNPLFAGVLWDVQDVFLEDVLRIEVIRGPGATVWGANAVNGVINIITKPSSQTHGSYAIAGAGTLEQGFVGARQGGRTAGGVDYRVWGKWYERDTMDLVDDTPNDGTEQSRIGFRTDWTSPSEDQFTFQGQYYNGQNENLADRDFSGRVRFDEPVSGGNLLTRWTRTHSEDHESSLQMYYDRYDRKTFGFGQQINVFDLDYQNHYRYANDHAIIWGAGYRAIFDKLTNTDPLPYIAADPERRTVQRFSTFIQDEMTLLEDLLYFTVGSKFSHNTYSNFEVQPSVRMLWLPSESEAAWCAISRAVRTPSRLSADGRLIINQSTPLGNFPLGLNGVNDLGAENLTAYEIGYRQQTNDYFSWDATAYFNDYENLHTLQLNFPPAALPYLDLVDSGAGNGYGFEVSATAQMTHFWTMRGWYSFQRIDFAEPSSALVNSAGQPGELPRNQVSLTNSFDLRRGREFDVITRYVDQLPAIDIPAYVAVDARFGWRLGRNFSASVVGRNLLDHRHPEFGANDFTGDVPTEVPRSVHAYLEWQR